MKLNLAYRSRKPKAQAIIKLRHFKKGVTDGEIILHYKTKFLISKQDYKNKTVPTKIKHAVENCIDYILEKFLERGENYIPTKEWLHNRCNEFFEIDEQEDTLLINWIDVKIKDLINTGLSSNTISNYKVLKDKVTRYNKGLELKDLTAKELDRFKNYLREEEKYGIGTINKDIDHIKSVLSIASRTSKFPDDFRYWQKFKQSKSAKYKDTKVIVIDEEEIKRIEELKLDKPHLINARKWLIIGINTGQRVNELLSINKRMFKIDNDILVLDFSQNKQGQANRIPALPKVKAMYDSDELPYKVSDVKLNIALKTLGKMAKVDTKINSYLNEQIQVKRKDGLKTVERNIKAVRPKYMYFQTKIFRRTFSTYWIDKMPPEEIRKFTGHKTNEMLYTYVAEARPDFSKWKQHLT